MYRIYPLETFAFFLLMYTDSLTPNTMSMAPRIHGMGRLHIYSFSRGPLRKEDVAKGPLWQQSYRLDSFSRGSLRQMDVAEGPL